MPASLGELVVSIAGDIAKLELAMSRAELLTSRTAKKIDDAMEMANKSIMALGAGFVGFKALEGLEQSVEGAIAAAAELEKLSKQTATSAEQLSKFKSIAAASNTDIRTVATGLQTMSKVMVETAAGTGRARDTLYGLGLSVKDLTTGKLKDAGDFMLEFAKRTANMSNETERLGVLQKVQKGTGAELAEFYRLLADEGDVVAKVTNRQAWEAEQYEKSLRKLDAAKKQLYNTVAQQVTPVLTALVRTYTDLITGTDGLSAKAKELQQQNTIREWAISAGIGVAMLVDGLRYVGLGIKIIGDGVVATATVFIGAVDIMARAIFTLTASMGETGEMLKGIGLIMAGQWTLGVQVIQGALDRLKGGWKDFGTDAKRTLQAVSDEFDALGYDIDTMLGEFKQGKTVDAFLEQLAKVGDGFKGTGEAAAGAGAKISTYKKDAIDGLTNGLVKQNAQLVVEIQSWREIGKGTKETAVAIAAAQLKEMEANGTLAEHTKRTGESAEATKKRVLALALLHDGLQHQLDDEMAYAKALEETRKATFVLVDQNIALTEQLATLNMLPGALSRYRAALLDEKAAALEMLAGVTETSEEFRRQAELLREIATKQDTLQSLRDQAAMWTQVADLVGNFSKELVTNAGGAVQYLRNQLKQLLGDLIALFAKRWVLNLLASATGDASLGSLASTIGGNTIAGGILNWLGMGGSAAGAAGAAGVMGSSGMIGAFNYGYHGMQIAGTAGQQFANTLGSWTATLLPYLAIIAGVVTSAGLYSSGWHGQPGTSSMGTNDLGRITGTPIWSPAAMIANWTDRGLHGLGFSPRMAAILSGTTGIQRLFGWKDPHADAAGIQGSFTGMNFTGSNYQDMSRRGGLFRSDQRWTDTSPLNTDQSNFFSSFMDNLKGIMTWLGNTLHVDAAQVLANYTHAFQIQLTNDGKPLSDDEVNNLLSGLVGSVLQEQLGLMFDAAGKTSLAAYVRGLQGTGAELNDAINSFLAVMSGAMQAGLKNFTVESVMAMQRSGESLGDAFTRLMTAYGDVVDKFTPDSTKLVNAQTDLTALYGDLTKFGYEVPTTRAGWLSVMQSLDMSTAAGQELFERMIALAPAFDAVSSAAEQMMGAFDDLMGRLRPGYTAGRQQMQLDTDVGSFMAANSWTHGMTPQQVIEQLGTITREDFSHYSNANQQLILSILGLNDTLHQTATAAQGLAAAWNYGQVSAAGGQAGTDYASTVGGLFTGDFKTKMPAYIATLNGEIDRLNSVMNQPGMVGTPEWVAAQSKMSALLGQRMGAQGDLNRYWELESVSPGHGEQLLNLEKWFDQSKALLQGNAQGMLELEAEFQRRRTEIIAGGVAGSLDAMKGLRDWRDSLLTDQNLSPLTLQQQMAVAASQYQNTLAGVQGGDGNTAGLQADAQKYLEIARQVFPSLSTTYEALFRQIMLDTGGVVGESPTDTNAKLAAAIPSKSTLASSADIKVLSDSLGDITMLLSKVITTSDPAAKAALDNVADAIKKLGQKGVLAQ